MSGREWTNKEDRQLKAAYPDSPSRDIAKLLGRTASSVYQRANILGLKKNPGYLDATWQNLSRRLQESGKSHRYPKGHIPANKGRKMPEDVYAKVRATMFKKGHVPGNHKPLGHERVNIYGYTEVKVAEPDKFVLKHRLVWEQANGPIPAGYNVQFRDGNTQNTSLDNLYLISRSDQMKYENSMHARYPEDIRKSIQLMGALQRQINKKKNDE